MGAIPTAARRAGELPGRTCSPSTSRREGQISADRGGHQHPSFWNELHDDIAKDFMAHMLVVAPDVVVDNPEEAVRYLGAIVAFGGTKWVPLWLTPQGWSLFDVWHIRAVGVTSLLVTSHSRNAARYAQAGNGHVVFFDSNTRDLYNNWFRGMMGREKTHIGPLMPLRGAARRILIPRASRSRLAQPGIVGRNLWASAAEEWSNKDWIILRIGDCSKNFSVLQTIADGSVPTGDADSVAEWYLPKDGVLNLQPSRVARVWADIVKFPIVPFRLDERRHLLAYAYEKLAVYIAAHEELQKQRIAKPAQPYDCEQPSEPDETSDEPS